MRLRPSDDDRRELQSRLALRLDYARYRGRGTRGFVRREEATP